MRFEIVEVFGIFVVEQVGASTYISALQLVKGLRMVAQFKVALAEAQVEKRDADTAGAVHNCGKVVAAGNVVATKEVGVADGSQDPGGGRAIELGLGKQIPCFPVQGERIGKAVKVGVGVALRAKAVYFSLHFIA